MTKRSWARIPQVRSTCEKCGLERKERHEDKRYGITLQSAAYEYSRAGVSCAFSACTSVLDADDVIIRDMYLAGHTVRSICRFLNTKHNGGREWTRDDRDWVLHFNLNSIRSRITKIRKHAQAVR